MVEIIGNVIVGFLVAGGWALVLWCGFCAPQHDGGDDA